MALRCGIVGLPNVGKSTIFNALTAAGAQMANFPFCTIEPNVGVVAVPSRRLLQLAQLSKSVKTTFAAMEFVDIAGLVAGASRGEGLGNQFLGHIREVSAILHVVRCFEDDDITHVAGRVDPDTDVEVIDTELILADLASFEKRLNGVAKKAQSGDPAARQLAPLYKKIIEAFDQGIPLRAQGLNQEERALITDIFPLTLKPMFYVCNVAEGEVAEAMAGNHPMVQAVTRRAQREGAETVIISGAIEAEISELAPAERADYLAELGLAESGLDRLIRAAFKLLGLITFFTTGPKESRAWPIPRGTSAPEAAGEIHSDLQRGFIRAEVIPYDDFVACGGENKAKEAGKMRLEGKDYLVSDGDVIYFRFNV